MKTQEAADYLRTHPLTVSADDATALDKAIKKPLLDMLIAAYDAAVDRANAADQCPRVHFNALPLVATDAMAVLNAGTAH